MRRFGVLGKVPGLEPLLEEETVTRGPPSLSRTVVSPRRQRIFVGDRRSRKRDGRGPNFPARARGSTPRGLLHPVGDHARACAGRPPAARSIAPAAAHSAGAEERAPGATTGARTRSAAARRTSRRRPPAPLRGRSPQASRAHPRLPLRQGPTRTVPNHVANSDARGPRQIPCRARHFACRRTWRALTSAPKARPSRFALESPPKRRRGR